MANVQIHQLHYKSDEHTILDVTNQELPCRSMTGIIGHNGSGKTTLLKALAGLIPEAKCSAEIPDDPMVMVLHHTPFIRMSVVNNLRLLKSTYPLITEEKIAQVIHHFDLQHLANRPATKLSAGEKQRLSLARAYLTDAKLLLLDEPTSSLDPNTTLKIESHIKELHQLGIRFFIISHDFAQVKRLCEDVVLMQDGKIIEVGPTKTFFSSPKTSEAKLFLNFYQTAME
jgi:tungstate transport system ATP-binding protein